MASVLVPRPQVATYTPHERARVARLLDHGVALSAHMGTLPPGLFNEAGQRVFRRFVLEALVALRAEGGALRANALARATGLRAQGFANKSRELVALGAVDRVDLGGRPPAVEYRLTPKGRALGSLATALTSFKALQSACALDVPGAGGFGFPVPDPRARRATTEAEVRVHLAGAVEEAEALADEYLAHRGGARGPGAEELRRYAETCVRRWHAEVLLTVESEARRYAEIKQAIGAGDEALTRALRSLTALGSVQKDGPLYRISPWGLSDLCIGAGLVYAAVVLDPPMGA